MLSVQQQEQAIKEFPNIKLSYENIVHKKVYADFMLAIPEGKRFFAWFTTSSNNSPVCYVLELGENKQIINIRIANGCFASNLSYGTILYGTIFNYLNNDFFSIEDIFFYKGKDITNYNWINKLEILNQLMSGDIKQIAYNKSFIVFGLPIMTKSFEELTQLIKNINYKIKCVQFRIYTNKNVSQYLEFKNINMNMVPSHLNRVSSYKKEVIFKIKPDIQNDIYNLYCYDNKLNSLVNYDIAHIPDFKTSVMMNKLFRNIKENNNLDALEESDTEEEFENEKEDRFVYLDKEFDMICTYNNKFKRWVPLKISDNKSIVNYSELKNII
jgi:hypothetical protein